MLLQDSHSRVISHVSSFSPDLSAFGGQRWSLTCVWDLLKAEPGRNPGQHAAGRGKYLFT